MIYKFFISIIFILPIYGCTNKAEKTVPVKIRISDSMFRIEERELNGFVKLYDRFYRYKDGTFFIKSYRFNEEKTNNRASLTEIYIEIPFLDSSSFKPMGQYLKDKTKVLCVFDNSDGGNYLELKSVDAGSFTAFKNIFGGKDSCHVFFQDKLLSNINSKHVKVYSKYKNCTNCEGYFKDGNVVYFGTKRISEPGFEIPKEYKYIEY